MREKAWFPAESNLGRPGSISEQPPHTIKLEWGEKMDASETLKPGRPGSRPGSAACLLTRERSQDLLPRVS